ncbi:hypothetical protein DL95DRAFT_468701 [Leptodontidium sp. 2 PMI_412]|nr:hypothetical protein DL95DRAFT_468701 [Leptodontidium sp. 2 PMI_412]
MLAYEQISPGGSTRVWGLLDGRVQNTIPLRSNEASLSEDPNNVGRYFSTSAAETECSGGEADNDSVMADFTHMDLGHSDIAASPDEALPPAKLKTPRTSLPASATFFNPAVPTGPPSNTTRLVPFNFPLTPMTKSSRHLVSNLDPSPWPHNLEEAPPAATYHQSSGSGSVNKSISKPGDRAMNRGQAVSTSSSIQVSTSNNYNAVTHISSPATVPAPIFGGSSVVIPRSGRNPLPASSPASNNSANSNNQNTADLGASATPSSTPSSYVASRASIRTTSGKGRRALPRGGGARR